MKNLINKLKCWCFSHDWEIYGKYYEFAGRIASEIGLCGIAIKGNDWWYCKRCNKKL